jgi:hypothetical protein
MDKINWITEHFNKLASTEWWLSENLQIANIFLDEISKTDNLSLLLKNVEYDTQLLNLCEELGSLYKLVLLNHTHTKTRVRLHYFKKYSQDVIHNHKWPFISRIICGNVIQHLFKTALDTAPLASVKHLQHSSYYLSTDCFHALEVESGIITLILRGPDLLSNATWYNKERKEDWKHTGGEEDTRMRKLKHSEVVALTTTILNTF